MIIGEFGARFIVEDSTAVVLEVGVSIKVDGVRSIFVDGISIDISRDFLVSTDGSNNLGFVKLAAISVTSGVWVVSFQAISSLSKKGIESTVNPSTVAVTSTTVNEHLFGEGNEVISGSSPGSFCTSYGGESPAASTAGLILDGVKDSFVSPIPCVWGT